MHIVEATSADTPAALDVERHAFGRDDEATLVAALLRDPTARPCLSLLAWDGGQAVGHALFTHASLTGADPVAPYGGAAFHDNRVWMRPA